MNLYRQSIILFGIVLPVLIGAAVIGVCFMLKSKMVASFENKQTHYRSYEQSRIGALEIEAKIGRQRPHVERWARELSEETASAVNNHLRSISEKLPSKEFSTTGFDRTNAPGGFGSISAQRSSQLRIGLRGTYRSVQRAFLELETRMPQLQLQELRIDPASSQASLLNINVSYTAWEN
jgi:hypothetical protein